MTGSDNTNRSDTVYRIFGYGSLINQESLAKTIGSPVAQTPAFARGFRRNFQSECPNRLNEYNQPVSALNIVESEKTLINGVYFYTNQNQFKLLCEREANYSPEQITLIEEHTQSIVQAYTFIDRTGANIPFYSDDFNQKEYLSICLEGAKHFGHSFYSFFVSTTYIHDSTLKDLGY